MLNEVSVEGIVVYSYAYNKDLLVRIACYRDNNRPQKPSFEEGKEKPDYVNLRFIDGVTKQLAFPDNLYLRAKGYLQSREYSETLVEFLTKAKKNPITSQMDVSVVGGKPNQIMCGRNAVEIVVENYTIIQQAPSNNEPASRKAVLNPNAGKGPVSTETTKKPAKPSSVPTSTERKTKRIHRGNTGSTAVKAEQGL